MVVGIIIGSVAFVVIVLVLVGIIIKKRRWLGIDVKKVEELKLADLIAFFKNPEILEKLRSSPEFIPVAIKENKKDKYLVVACLFDHEKNVVVEFNRACEWKAKKLSADLEEAFADKDMITLS